MKNPQLFAQEQPIPEFVFFLLFGGGAIATVCAALDNDWFFNHYKTALLVKLFGRPGARIFYGVMGLLMIGSGVFFLVRG